MASGQSYGDSFLKKLPEIHKNAEEYDENTAGSDLAALQDLVEQYERELKESFSQLKLTSPVVTLKNTDLHSNDMLCSKGEMLLAELDITCKRKVTGYPYNRSLLLELLKQNLEKQIESLQQGISSLHSEEASFKAENERLDKLLISESSALTILKNELKSVNEDEMVLDETKKIQDLALQITNVRRLTQLRMSQLEAFLMKNFPSPHSNVLRKTQKKGVLFEEINAPDIKTLAEILEETMNAWLDSPHDPWVTLDETFWPPYLELLLKTRILQRHPQNAKLVKMTSYHV